MPRGITEQDVFEAADQLLARGERPTIERVRQTLGTGSPNTVNRLLDIWWASLSKRMSGHDDGALPASILGLCRQLYEGMKSEAIGQGQIVAQAQLADLETARQLLEQDRVALAAERTHLQMMSDALRHDLAKTAEENASLRAQLAAAVTSQTVAEKRLIDAETQNGRLGRQIADNEVEGRAEIARIREQWDGNERRWLREIDQLRVELKASQSARDKEVRASEQRLQQQRQLVADRDKQIAKLQDESIVRERRLAQEQQARVAAESELNGINRALAKTPGRSVRKSVRTSQRSVKK